MNRIKQAIDLAEKEGFLRTKRRNSKSTLEWWWRCESADRPWLILSTSPTRAYFKIDIATKRTARQLTDATVDRIIELFRLVTFNSPRAGYWRGPIHLTFDQMTVEDGDAFAQEVARLLSYPDCYEYYQPRNVVSVSDARRCKKGSAA